MEILIKQVNSNSPSANAPTPEPDLPDTSAQRESASYTVTQKDKTKYLFNNMLYGKSRLVLAVVKKYVEDNPDITARTLESTFDKRIQGSLGVVRLYSEAKQTSTQYERRFFCSSGEIIHTSTEDCVVCSQWGKFNIDNFILRAEELGMKITKIM